MKNNIKKVNCEFEVIQKEEKKFTLNINDKEKVLVYNEDLIEQIIENKFNKKYRKLLYLVMEINENEDSDESDINNILLKIEELKNLILNKYFKYLNKNLINKYLKMILLLEEKIKMPRLGKGR